jgi:hypothetical protein
VVNQHARSKLKKFRNLDPFQINKEGLKKKMKYDPRMPHPRKIFSRNYHHIVASKLFPKEKLVASCKRLPNLGEIISTTIQNTTC